jgi:hypothetical protein
MDNIQDLIQSQLYLPHILQLTNQVLKKILTQVPPSIQEYLSVKDQ